MYDRLRAFWMRKWKLHSNHGNGIEHTPARAKICERHCD